MKYLLLACISFLCFTTNLPAQNLVPNPSFEELTSCPVPFAQDSTEIEKARHWFTTYKNDSPDLYNECTGKEWGYIGAPNVPAKTGKGYAGMLCYGEQLEVRLKNPLVKDKTYSVQMYVCTPFNDRSLFSYRSILRFCFTKTMLTLKFMHDSVIDKRVLWIVNSDSNKSNHTKWKLFSTRYRAKGGENYFTFGGLNSSGAIDEKLMYDERGRKVDVFRAYYYYIDDVSVEEVKGTH